MSQLIQLRRKIKSISTTKKITYAMRLTSMSLYSRLEKQHVNLGIYKKQVETLFKKLSNLENTWNSDILYPKDLLNSSPLIIIVASSKGLCGSFNTNLIRYIKQHLILEEHQTPSFITVGSKAHKFAKQQKFDPIIANFDDFNSYKIPHISKDVIKLIKLKNGEFSSVKFFSSFFINFFQQKPTETIMIPLQEVEKNNPEPDILMEPILEQPYEEIMEFLGERYLTTFITNLLFQSILSEQAARFLAMDSATTNANKLIEALVLKYNKSRQALITKELTELTASFSHNN